MYDTERTVVTCQPLDFHPNLELTDAGSHMPRKSHPKKEVEAYNMIKIEFNELANEELLNAASIAEYVGVEFKSKNSQLLIYQEWLSLIFFIINVVNTLFWYYKLSKIESSELGTVRRLISLGLLIMMLFNLPYRLFL